MKNRALVVAGHLVRSVDTSGRARIESDQALLVEDGLVAEIGPAERLARSHPDLVPSGGPGFLVTPGLVNAHHHLGLTPLQLGSPDHALELWFATRLALRDVDPRLDTLYSAFEMIASGVTTVQHLQSRAPGRPEDVLRAGESILAAYREIGMRASYSLALRDQNRLVYEADEAFVARAPEGLRAGLRDYFARFALTLGEQVEIFHAMRRRVADDPLLRVQLAPSNLHWLSEPALAIAADVSDRYDVPMHMHVLETRYQKAYARRRVGGSALRHLQKVGLLTPRLTIGHGVWMSEDDIALCAGAGVHICHNCSSNMRLKSGVAPVNRFMASGIPVALGLDEAGINDDRDMLQEMRLVLNVHREPGIDAPCPTANDVFRMATEHGAGTTPFAGTIGRLDPGMAADLVLFDWRDVTYPYQSSDIPILDTLVRRAKAGAVRSVMIAGSFVYRDRRFTRVDRDAVLAEIADALAKPLTPAEAARRELARTTVPLVEDFYAGYLDAPDDEPHYRMSGRH